MKHNPLDDLPKVHPRQVPVQQAKNALAVFLEEWRKRHELTLSEQLMLQADAVTSALAGCVRAERREKA